jgi:hypothetical protein
MGLHGPLQGYIYFYRITDWDEDIYEEKISHSGKYEDYYLLGGDAV